MGRIGNNGVLTAAFVEPATGAPTTVTNVSVYVADTSGNVHVRTLDAASAVIHDCPNVFAGCPFTVESTTTPIQVKVLFPGGGIARVEFIDEDADGRADGFTIDDLVFELQIAPVLKTGQLGTFVARDDGDLQMGFAWTSPRFVSHGDGTVTDTLTGLMWMQNARLNVWTVTWDEALQLVIDLNDSVTAPLLPAGYTDWRLPNINELESLIDYDSLRPALPRGHPFQNVQPSSAVGVEATEAYWSSTPVIAPG